jgi:hypothetical protein
VDGQPGDLDRLGVEVDDDPPCADHRLRMALGPADDRVDARDQLLPVEGLGHVVVGAKPKPLSFDSVLSSPDEDGRLDLGEAQLAQHLVPVHVGKVQVQQDQVVVVELGEIDPLLPESVE